MSRERSHPFADTGRKGWGNLRYSVPQLSIRAAFATMNEQMVRASQSRFCCRLSNNFDGCCR